MFTIQWYNFYLEGDGNGAALVMNLKKLKTYISIGMFLFSNCPKGCIIEFCQRPIVTLYGFCVLPCAPFSCRASPRLHQFHILRSSLELLNSRRQQLFPAHLVLPIYCRPRGDCLLYRHDRLLSIH